MQGLLCLQAFTLGLLTVGGLTTPESLFLLTLLLGAATAIAQPARLSLVPSLVGRDDIPSAVAVNSIGWNSARFIGPTLAGPLLLHLGPVSGAGWAFLCNTATFAVFLIVLPMLRLSPRCRRGASAGACSRRSATGFRYIGRHAGVGPADPAAAGRGAAGPALCPSCCPPLPMSCSSAARKASPC